MSDDPIQSDLVDEPEDQETTDPVAVAEQDIKADIAKLTEDVEEFFSSNPLVVALHNLLSGHKIKNDDGTYTLTVKDEHVGDAHDALASASGK